MTKPKPKNELKRAPSPRRKKRVDYPNPDKLVGVPRFLQLIDDVSPDDCWGWRGSCRPFSRLHKKTVPMFSSQRAQHYHIENVVGETYNWRRHHLEFSCGDEGCMNPRHRSVVRNPVSMKTKRTDLSEAEAADVARRLALVRNPRLHLKRLEFRKIKSGKLCVGCSEPIDSTATRCRSCDSMDRSFDGRKITDEALGLRRAFIRHKVRKATARKARESPLR